MFTPVITKTKRHGFKKLINRPSRRTNRNQRAQSKPTDDERKNQSAIGRCQNQIATCIGLQIKKRLIMTPTRYAVEDLRNGRRTEHQTESQALEQYERLKKEKTPAWIVNIYE